jgi:hypothetical protein
VEACEPPVYSSPATGQSRLPDGCLQRAEDNGVEAGDPLRAAALRSAGAGCIDCGPQSAEDGDVEAGEQPARSSPTTDRSRGDYTFFLKYFLENEIFLDNLKYFGLDFLRK